MDFEGRAARRPMPRQMDVSDWNVDVDVRTGVSSSALSYQRDRSALDTRATVPDPTGRLSSGDELRNDVRDWLRPVNRYDVTNSNSSTSSHVREETPAYTSAWRVRDSVGRSVPPRDSRATERVLAMDPGPQRLQPRSIANVQRVGESFLSSPLYRDAGERASRVSDVCMLRDPTPSRTESSVDSSRVGDRQLSYEPTSPVSIDSTPPRQLYRYASPSSTVRSEASTALTSSPFAPSVTDTPSSTSRSLQSPPYTPSRDDDSVSYDLSTESTPSTFRNRPYSHESSPSSPAGTSTFGGDTESLSTLTSATVSTQSPPADDRPRPPAAPAPPSSNRTISPRAQREQLYDFRRDMRQVFARVDEMVDLHRDMFKCDAFSGMPAFNAVMARETTSFANETFEQLTKLRDRFEEMTTAWASAASRVADAGLEAARRDSDRADIDATTRRPEEPEEPSFTSTRSPASGTSERSVTEASVSAEVTTASPLTRQGAGAPERSPVRSRWEPSLSALSNDEDECSSSTSSASVSEACSSSLPSLSRPSTASSASVTTTKSNVFEDFDKRMEEIRASLQAIARDKPRPSPSPRRFVTDTANKASVSSHNHNHDDNDDDDASVESRENNARVGNRTPWRRSHPDPSATTSTNRHDREARLRQLLRELQTTGEHLDDGSSSPRA